MPRARRLLAALALALGFLWPACAAPAAPHLHRNPVVRVEYQGLREMSRQEQERRKLPPWTKESYTATGSGFFANRSGDIVTNHHVITQQGLTTRQIVVTVDGEWQYPARVVHADKATDLAVIRIEADKKTLLPVLELGTPATAGATVSIQGYPGGGPFRTDRGKVMRTGHLLECAIPVAVGNSGGPVLSERGHVVGVVTGMRKRSFGGQVVAEFCLVVPVQTVRRQLKNWRVKHP